MRHSAKSRTYTDKQNLQRELTHLDITELKDEILIQENKIKCEEHILKELKSSLTILQRERRLEIRINIGENFIIFEK